MCACRIELYLCYYSKCGSGNGHNAEVLVLQIHEMISFHVRDVMTLS